MLRYTPTCVGKTWTSINIDGQPTVHPHMRGENYTVIVIPLR